MKPVQESLFATPAAPEPTRVRAEKPSVPRGGVDSFAIELVEPGLWRASVQTTVNGRTTAWRVDASVLLGRLRVNARPLSTDPADYSAFGEYLATHATKAAVNAQRRKEKRS